MKLLHIGFITPLILILTVLAPPASAEIIDQWTFNPRYCGEREASNYSRPYSGDGSQSFNAVINGDAVFSTVNPAIVLNGDDNYLSVEETVTPADLPQGAITVEAWVSLQEGRKPGGIIGYLKHEGDVAHGWALGYDETRFTFCVSDGVTLHFIRSETEFKPAEWYHVAGTYDGTVMILYINGKAEASSNSCKGDISYRQTDYIIGAYHDGRTHDPMRGSLNKISVHNTALTDNDIRESYSRSGTYEEPEIAVHTGPRLMSLGPYIEFTRDGSALVRWTTDEEYPTILEYGVSDADEHRIEDMKPKTDHLVKIENLKQNTQYVYAVVFRMNERELKSKTYICDTFFNYNLPPVPEIRKANKSARQKAAKILVETGISQGYCLIAGCGDGSLASEISYLSSLKVVCIDTDPNNVKKARDRLRKSGLYGSHVSVRKVGSYDEMPFRAGTFNLIVIDGAKIELSESMQRLLVPGKGVAYVGKSATTVSREARIETGSWTHQYGAPHNASFTGESLNGMDSTEKLDVQWLGRPGPRAMVDRNPRVPAPLALEGRLFTQGFNRIIAQDSYNGTVLWSREIPNSIRFNMPRDTSNWCADSNNLYMAVLDKCWRIGAVTGELAAAYDPIAGPKPDWSYIWGFIARSDDLLFGSAVKKGATYTAYWSGVNWYDGHVNENNEANYGVGKVCSDNIFALDARTGNKKWTYQKGVILNTTITIHDNGVFFLESRNPEILKGESRKIGSPKLWDSMYLVALDKNTGELRWERQIKHNADTPVAYLSAADNSLILATSQDTKQRYNVFAYDVADGSLRWSNGHPWTGTNHSGHMQHPVIVNGKIYLEPTGYDLETGAAITDLMGRHEGCATYMATTGALIYRGRGRQVAMWDFDDEKVTTWSRLRPGCWLTTIAADGLLLSPEGGGGCSCGNWMETSIVFTPLNCLPPKPASSQTSFVGTVNVELASQQENSTTRYTVDGTSPSDTSPEYTGPIVLDDSGTVLARSYLPDGVTSPEVRFVFTRLEPRDPDTAVNLEPGLDTAMYEGDFKEIPDFNDLKPSRTGVSNSFTTGFAGKTEKFALLLTGYLLVSQEGLYTFYTQSDDGSQLYIGDKLVVDNGGRHGPRERSGDIGLKAGIHAITVAYFNAAGGGELSASYEGPNIYKCNISADILMTEGR